MNGRQSVTPHPGSNRRSFLKKTARLASAVAATGLAVGRAAHAAGSDVLKIGLIGCGGRGSGAAVNAMNADHHATVFDYGEGLQMFAYCRQINGTKTEISDKFVGTKGRCDLLRHAIEGETNWKYEGPPCNRFDLEHVALFSAIRSGVPVNNSTYMARSSLLALMATWCSHTGQEISWQQALDSVSAGWWPKRCQQAGRSGTPRRRGTTDASLSLAVLWGERPSHAQRHGAIFPQALGTDRSA